jgi:predicted nucleotidyltransferase
VPTSIPLPAPSLSPQVQQTLSDFVQAAGAAFNDRLQAVVLFGSAAEGRLRPTSDVNVVLVLSAFEQAQADQLRQPLRLAHAAIKLQATFLLREEIPAAVRSFAPKFADILRRRFVLFGEDPFASVAISRDAEIRQLRQQLLNMTLRLRSVYVARGLREYCDTDRSARQCAHRIGVDSGHPGVVRVRPAVGPSQCVRKRDEPRI